MTVEHRTEVVADLREFFSASLWGVPMLELAHLLRALLADPRSRLHAKVAGWDHPVSYEAIYQLETIDTLLALKLGDKFKPVARPWDKKRPAVKKRTRTEALRILRPHLFED